MILLNSIRSLIRRGVIKSILLILCLSLPLYSVASAPLAPSTPTADQFIFPVNVVKQRINLTITIPKTFKQIESGSPTLLEFIPVNDSDPYNWSEIITLRPFIGNGLSAQQIVEHVVESIKHRSRNFKLIERKIQKHELYEEVSALIVYNNGDRIELLYLYAAAGPYDSINVQYAKTLKSRTEIPSARNKIKAFLSKNVEMLRN